MSSYQFVVTLISQNDEICESDLRAVQDIIGTTFNAPSTVEWLNRPSAVDLMWVSSQTVLKDFSQSLDVLFAERAIDTVVQPMNNRRKNLFLADMDSTMIEQECIDELAEKVGLKAQVSEITERAMRGEIDFEPALQERVALLKDLPAGVVDDLLNERITLMPGARALVQTMRKNGAYTCLVSGGFTLFTGPVADKIGFHEHHANHLIVDSGCLTGDVQKPILGKEAKRQTLLALRARLALQSENTMAVGDGANDLLMLQEAGLGVAYHAKPAVAEAAHARIDHNDLTALLYIQGYKSADGAIFV